MLRQLLVEVNAILILPVHHDHAALLRGIYEVVKLDVLLALSGEKGLQRK